MRCAWKELLDILPPWMREGVDQQGRDSMQELRLRTGAVPELVKRNGSVCLKRQVCMEDLKFVVNIASRYSPWASVSSAQGYITAPGGHRIGLCGTVVYSGGKVTGFQEIYSMCIRVARDFKGIGRYAYGISGSVLILGAPGWGKTTLLRDLSREIGTNETVAVVDERSELFPIGMQRGEKMDVLTGCPKSLGIPMVLRTMGPQCIAVDEITEEADTRALLQAANCGVRLLATAHSATIEDFCTRSVYRPLHQAHVFGTYLLLNRDKSYRTERIAQ